MTPGLGQDLDVGLDRGLRESADAIELGDGRGHEADTGVDKWIARP